MWWRTATISSQFHRGRKQCGLWKSVLEKAQLELTNGQCSVATSTTSSYSIIPATLTTEKFFFTPSFINGTYQSAGKEEKEINNSNKLDMKQVLGTADMSFISRNIQKLIECDHPLLNTVSSYYFNAEGKKLRPLLVLLTAKMHKNHIIQLSQNENRVDDEILHNQKILAFITEMIHTASLMHDDVIDDAETRRGKPSANYAFGNKMSILAGDFLLSRASVALARLGSLPVVELLAEVIGELVEGEVMQLNNQQSNTHSSAQIGNRQFLDDYQLSESQLEQFDIYLRKTYMKTASLMAKSCQASILLRDENDWEMSKYAFEFGKNIGIAFQLIDDYLDFASSSDHVGKPSGGADLRLGLTTAPVLFAQAENDELRYSLAQLMKNGNFSSVSEEEEISRLVSLIRSSDGMEKTKQLAKRFSDRAVKNLKEFAPSTSRYALEQMAENIVNRTK